MSRLIGVRNYLNVIAPFAPLFKEVEEVQLETFQRGFKFKDGDVVLLGGGGDISTAFYGQKPNRFCGSTGNYSSRDREEKAIVEHAIKNKIPLLGICRGSQLLCAMAGGSLFQHVTNHAGQNHTIKTNKGIIMPVSSAHHQMMNPFNVKHELIAWSEHTLSNVHLVEEEKNINVPVEPEVVFFPDIMGLAIQYHPEFMNDEEQAVVYARDLVTKYLIKKDF